MTEAALVNACSPRFEQALAAFDAANARDPNRDRDDDGRILPRQLLYARRMSACLAGYRPAAPEALRLAARAQHLRRWEIARADYPAGRQGYLHWRRALQRFHAAAAAAVLREVGYDDALIGRVQTLLLKTGLRRDADAQCLEDVICAVFLRYYCAEFARPHAPDKVRHILVKTWAKMSPRGRDFALRLALPAPTRSLVEQALAAGA